MARTDIDLTNQPENEENVFERKLDKKPKRKKKFISKVIIYLLVIFVILFISLAINVVSSGENLSKTLGDLGLWGQIKHLVASDDKKLAGEEEDRINVLLLGMGGIENGFVHDGPFLSDTIIIASFKPSTEQVALISVPRDLLVLIPDYGWRKVNHANAYGEANEPGQGGELTRQVISEVFDLPIHYYVRIDFAGFKKIIDDLGGVNVDVENIIDDYNYPIPGKETATTSERYEHLYIEKGKTKMNGELALKYVRSRQSIGIEGSDFARSKRQQKILMAVKDKGLSISTLINPYKINKVMDTLSQHLATDVKIWEILRFFDLGKNVKEENIVRRVFNAGPDGSLYPAITEGGAFILQAKSGDFSELQQIVRNVFDSAPEIAGVQTEPEPAEPEPPKPEPLKPQKIEIQNGTKINGLASRTSQRLENLDYEVIKIKNAPTQDYQKTVIYNLNDNPKDETTTALAKLLDCEVASFAPTWTAGPEVNAQTDILIILGQDQGE